MINLPINSNKSQSSGNIANTPQENIAADSVAMNALPADPFAFLLAQQIGKTDLSVPDAAQATIALDGNMAGAGPAMKALSNNSGGPAFEANNSAGTAIKAVGGNGVCFDGEGDLRVTGNIQRNYGNGSPSYHGTAPIAYASINLDGSVASGTPNVSCTWNALAQRYEITISGESYSTTGYVTTVTPVAIAPADTLFANTSSGPGQLRVRINSSSAGTVGQQKPFHFIVYKP